MVGWTGRVHSYVRRFALLKSCVASIPIYVLLIIIKFSRWTIDIINFQMSHFLIEVCDGENLRLTFIRNVSERLMDLWLEFVNIVESISLSPKEDHIIWSLVV